LSEPKRHSTAEQTVKEKYEKGGYLVLSRGWPDFACLTDKPPHRLIFVVEVKKGRSPLTKEQGLILRALEDAGIIVHIARMVGERVETYCGIGTPQRPAKGTGLGNPEPFHPRSWAGENRRPQFICKLCLRKYKKEHTI